jgi:hypothetical protein
MRISIWQQFSSNHSGDYTVVGVFESETAAYFAGITLKYYVAQIATWNQLNWFKLKDYGWKPNPAELTLAEHYGIDWKEPIDWLRHYRGRWYPRFDQREPEENVINADRLVFVESFGLSDTWQTGHQFVGLITGLGGIPYRNIFMGEDPDNGSDVYQVLELDLTCNTPTEQIAHAIYNHLTIHLNSPDESRINLWGPIPWIFHHPRYIQITNAMPHEEYQKVETMWLREQQKWRRTQNNEIKFHEFLESQEIYISYDLDSTIGQLRRDVIINRGICSYSENRVELKNIQSGHNVIAVVPALIGWMQSFGCTIDYVWREI